MDLLNVVQNVKTLIEESSDKTKRVVYIKCIGLLIKSIRKKNIHSDSIDSLIFTLLENVLIADEDDVLRAEAAKLLLRYYCNSTIKPLIRAIKHDTSGKVLKTIYDLVITLDNDDVAVLKRTLQNRFTLLEEIYHIDPLETLFLLDLEIESYMLG